MKNKYRLRVYLFSIAVCLASTFNVTAQVNLYGLVPLNGTFTPLVGGTQTSLGTTADDAISNDFPIGFNFVYDGITYTTVQASSNGPLLFGTGKTQTTTNNLATTTGTERPGVAALWDDIQLTAGVSYQVSGVAPYRKLTVEWLNMEWNYGSGTPVISFQVILYETSNLIDFVYRQESTAVNPGFSGGATIGIMGVTPTDFISLTDVSAAPVTSTSASTNSLVAKPATGQIYRFGIFPANPPTPVQDPAAPTCSAGTTLSVSGTPAANVTWYWQTSATGTSTATPYTGPYTVFANGTYYLSAFNSVTNVWSAAYSSVVVSNFPLASVPPSPVAAANPACVTNGTTLSMPAAPPGMVYYWQGTTVNGTSSASNAATPFPVAATGTYTVSAFETATGCWSNTSSVAVTVESYVPAAPTTSMANYNICSGVTSLMIDATPPPGGAPGTLTTPITTAFSSDGITAASFTFTAPAIPVGATITSAQLQLTNVESVNGSYRSEIRVATTGAYTLAPTQISTLATAGVISPDPVINLTGFPVAGGSITLLVTETYNDAGIDANFGGATLVVTYTQNPVSTLSWYNAPTGGTLLGTTSPFEAVGTSVLMNTNTAGAYSFYAASQSGACPSAARTQITVNVTEVLAVLTPVNVTCNGGTNGSFTLGTVQCGTAPFTYSINGGAFAAIPMNLAAGTYSVVMRDATMGTSAPISVVITQPAIPANLTLVDANYYNAQVSWTTTGNETQWIVEYGVAGFTPGSGLGTLTVNTTNATIPGLNPDTDYAFYVSADCGPVHNFAGPFAFSTNTGFFTFDNACGPGFTDISGTGTALNLGDDGVATVTAGFPLSLQGVTTNQVTISNNGYVTFGAVTLNAWNIDLDSEEGNVYHQTVTIGGANYFVVQWENRPKYPYAAGTGQNATFQLMVSQATGEIWYLYEDVVFGGSQSGNDYGLVGTISVVAPLGTVTVSNYNATYLTNNTCAHFYNELCPKATNASVDLIYSDDAILDWDAGAYGEGNWTLIYGLSGFDPTVPGQAIDTFELVTSDASFGSSLSQLTGYDVYIYSECQADNLTSVGTMVSFVTLPSCSNPSAFTAMTDIDSLEMAWNWTASSSDFPIASYNIHYGFSGFDLYSAADTPLNGTNNADTIVNTGFVAGGVYQVYIQAVCTDMVNGGTDTSTYVGPITFTMPLTNDDACGAEMLAANGTVYTFSNAGATVATGEAAIAPPATGAQTSTGWTNSTLNNTTWFTFVAPASGSVRVNNTAIGYNGQAAVYRATNCANFTTFNLIAANDNAIGGTSVAPNYTICGLTPLATYYLMHDGFNGTTGTYSISVTPIVLEAGTAAALSPICTGEDINLFTTVTGNDTGGVWSSSIPAVNVSITGSDLSSAGLAPQVYSLQYRMTDGCAFDSVMTLVQVYPLSSAGQDGTITACLNEPIDLLAGLNGNADLTGSWYNAASTLLPNSQVSASPTAGQFIYRYIAGNGVCDNDTANVVLNVVNTCNFLSVDEAIFNGVSVFPNPSEGVVFISSDATEAFDYVITDAKGRVVSAVTAGIKGAQTTEINLSTVETGIYFIRLTNATAEKTFRVVIQ